MKTLSTWLEEYGADHRNHRNQMIHRVCVPLIFFSIVGFLHAIPLEYASVHLGDLLILPLLFWYSLMGIKPVALMFLQWYVALAVVFGLNMSLGDTSIWIFLGVFIVAWIGQFWGHHIEGRRPSFLTDLKYLLIGPLWVWLGRH